MTRSRHPEAGSSLSMLWRAHIGPLPLPAYLVIAAVVLGASLHGRLPPDMIGGFAAIMVLGLLLGQCGSQLPVLKQIGGPAILCLFVPSALRGFGIMPTDMVAAITAVMKSANFLYLYIACLVAGSMLGMNRHVLIQGFLRIFAPLLVGTIAAVAVGIGLAGLFGYPPKHAFFHIVMPILAGGIGEGILPLSLAYSEILRTEQSSLIASLVPAALIGNVVAIVSAGALRRLGERFPRHSGNGQLVRADGTGGATEKPPEPVVEFPLMGAGLLIACSLFILGSLLAPVTGIPAPIVMILGTALLKISNIVPARMELGAYQMYRFMTAAMTFPLLVGLGTLYVPWAELVAAFSLPYVVICTGTVVAMVAAGWFVGALFSMYPVEAAIVTACHSGLGGTGDVAILSASNRMELMPFAQISTRIGGASMVVLAVLLLKAA